MQALAKNDNQMEKLLKSLNSAHLSSSPIKKSIKKEFNLPKTLSRSSSSDSSLSTTTENPSNFLEFKNKSKYLSTKLDSPSTNRHQTGKNCVKAHPFSFKHDDYYQNDSKLKDEKSNVLKKKDQMEFNSKQSNNSAKYLNTNSHINQNNLPFFSDLNNNSNYNSNNYFKSKCTKNCDEYEFENMDHDLKSSSSMDAAVRKKFKRVNKIFYNGFLNRKNDKRDSIMPEYQAHASELLHFLKSLWITNTMCDLSIVIDNKKYPAHRVGLAMFSKKYRSEFQEQLQNKNSGIYTICLKCTTHYALESILKYIYTANIDINPANVEEILAGAKELGIDNLICMASDYLSSLSIGDVLAYMGNMLTNDGSELMIYELYAYIMTHLDKISRTPEYLKSSICVVKTLLQDSHLCVKKELEVFDAAMRWIDFDKPRRINYLNEIMKTIRFTQISPEDLTTKVESQISLIENTNAQSMLFNAFKFHALNSSKNNKLTNYLKKEECRGACLKGASVPDAFVKAIVELSDIAQRLKKARKHTSNGIVDDCNSINGKI